MLPLPFVVLAPIMTAAPPWREPDHRRMADRTGWGLRDARTGLARTRPGNRSSGGRRRGAPGRRAQLVAVALEELLADEPEEPEPPSPLSARLRFLSPSFLKSVSYQPPPARRNDGAVTWRRTWPGALQEGQTSGSASDSFCRRSKA